MPGLPAFYGQRPARRSQSSHRQKQRPLFSGLRKERLLHFYQQLRGRRLHPGAQRKTFCGPKAFAEFFRGGYDDYGLRNGKFITTNVYGDGKEYVTEEGLWQSINAKGDVFDDGKFLVLWKKTSKGWKMYRDSFSSNHGAPPHP
ncbi:hypothetical protein ACQ86N_18320 [Puia sp. P3]|uniref:hypothetical protein n=1 Tax=Puia sp. P3 TaxID=3423952 RepID=UPI003D6743CB